MSLVAEKRKGKIYVYSDLARFEDTYNKVHIPDGKVKELGIVRGEYTEESPLWDFLKNHFIMVNLLSERVEVPDKKVISDREGTSKLIRKGSQIEIARRYKRKDGTLSNTTKTPNVCYIDNHTREKFFRDVKQFGSIVEGSRYTLTSQSGDIFEAWSKAMDREYTRLSGIPVNIVRKRTVIEVPRDEIVRIDDLRYELSKYLTLEDLLGKWVLQDNNRRAYYDIDGLFLQYQDSPCLRENVFRALCKVPISNLEDLARVAISLHRKSSSQI